jgi:hypothetical protein
MVQVPELTIAPPSAVMSPFWVMVPALLNSRVSPRSPPPDRSAVAPAATVVVPLPCSSPFCQSRVPPSWMVRLTAPASDPLDWVNVPPEGMVTDPDPSSVPPVRVKSAGLIAVFTVRSPY